MNSFETGLKNEFFGRHLRANLAAFYNDYRDLQVSYTDPAYPGNSVRGNAGKAHTLGVELETSARLPFGLGVQFGGGYLHAVYDTYKNANGPGVNADGNPLINSPKWNLTAVPRTISRCPRPAWCGSRVTCSGRVRITTPPWHARKTEFRIRRS